MCILESLTLLSLRTALITDDPQDTNSLVLVHPNVRTVLDAVN